jgi:hypothetical protein
MRSQWVLGLVVAISCGALAPVQAEQFLLADGVGWPGEVLQTTGASAPQLLYRRNISVSDEVIPRLRSITQLRDGRIVFCSGLDRSVILFDRGAEQRLHFGGGLVRQVRTDSNGVLYWSTVETPLDTNPLPDGFIYSWSPTTRQTTVVQTFSQGDVGHAWWGAFDVRGGRIWVASQSDPTTLFDVSHSPVERVAVLPVSAVAFRRVGENGLLVCDGAGKLYQFADLRQPSRHEVVLDAGRPFVDFTPVAVAP